MLALDYARQAHLLLPFAGDPDHVLHSIQANKLYLRYHLRLVFQQYLSHTELCTFVFQLVYYGEHLFLVLTIPELAE